MAVSEETAALVAMPEWVVLQALEVHIPANRMMAAAVVKVVSVVTVGVAVMAVAVAVDQVLVLL
jgi:hypothetical protein